MAAPSSRAEQLANGREQGVPYPVKADQGGPSGSHRKPPPLCCALPLRVANRGTVLLFLGSLAFSAVAAELALRAAFVQDDYYFLRQRYDVNSRGMRDTEHKPGPSSGLRILVLGDSFAFGQGVLDRSQTFPRTMETLLRQRCRRDDIEVIVGARMGWDIDEIEKYLDQEAWTYAPDFVVYTFFLNDFQMAATPRWSHATLLGTTADWLFRSSMLYYRLRKLKSAILEGLGMRRTYIQYLQDLCSPDANPEWPLFLLRFQRMSSKVRTAGATLAVATLPLMTRFDEQYPLGVCHSTLQALTLADGDYSIDLLEDFRQAGMDGRQLWAASFDSHPNVAAHRFIAERLAEHLVGPGLEVCFHEKGRVGSGASQR